MVRRACWMCLSFMCFPLAMRRALGADCFVRAVALGAHSNTSQVGTTARGDGVIHPLRGLGLQVAADKTRQQSSRKHVRNDVFHEDWQLNGADARSAPNSVVLASKWRQKNILQDIAFHTSGAVVLRSRSPSFQTPMCREATVSFRSVRICSSLSISDGNRCEKPLCPQQDVDVTLGHGLALMVACSSSAP